MKIGFGRVYFSMDNPGALDNVKISKAYDRCGVDIECKLCNRKTFIGDSIIANSITDEVEYDCRCQKKH